jgi:hypothetical protein
MNDKNLIDVNGREKYTQRIHVIYKSNKLGHEELHSGYMQI